jgi:serine/threonine protein kinase
MIEGLLGVPIITLESLGKRVSSPEPTTKVQNVPLDLAYRQGERIGGRYTVVDVLGKGGFGVVYRVRDREDNRELALKTFRDEFILDPRVRSQFRQEALTWVALGRHSFILQAEAVHEFDGRLFVAMDYIAPDENGLITLQDHIEHYGPNLTDRMIGIWAVEFCHGMTHAYANGIKAHRDIKPANILLESGIFVKISDFGIAASLQISDLPAQLLSSFGLTTFRAQGKTLIGTLGYIAPEIYAGQSADIRSDIYSFGAVLWQLCAGSPRPPFWEWLRRAPDAPTTYSILSGSKIPQVERVFWSVIARCSEPAPNARFQNFDEVRHAIKQALDQSGDDKFDFVVNTAPTFAQLVNQGASLRTLGRLDEALECYEAAIKLDPKKPAVWVNKGNVLSSIGKLTESMQAYEHALQLDPKFDAAWLNKGIQLQKTGKLPEAIECYDNTIRLNPLQSVAWNRKGGSLVAQNKIEPAIECYKKALEINPFDEVACTNLAEVFRRIGDDAKALTFYDRAISANSKYKKALIGKTETLIDLSRLDEALQLLDFVLTIDQEDFAALNMKAIVLCRTKRYRESIQLFDFLLANSGTDLEVLWTNKGNALAELEDWKGSLECFDRALAINPTYRSAVSQRSWVAKQLDR